MVGKASHMLVNGALVDEFVSPSFEVLSIRGLGGKDEVNDHRIRTDISDLYVDLLQTLPEQELVWNNEESLIAGFLVR